MKKRKFIGDFTIVGRGSAIHNFTDPRPIPTKIVADPRRNRTTAVCYSVGLLYMTTIIYDVLKNFNNFVFFTIIYDAKIERRRRKFECFAVENTNFPIENCIISVSNPQKSRLRRAESFQNISKSFRSSKNHHVIKNMPPKAAKIFYYYI